MNDNSNTFGGIESQFANPDTAKVVLIPVPYDGTSTWIKGSDQGPDAFLDAAKNMELYDIETNSEPYRQGIVIADPSWDFRTPEAMADSVEKEVSHWLSKGKLVSLFGGEHSISIGSLRAMMAKYNDLTVLQLDAHTDLRPEYEGSKCNHACAVYESSKRANLLQVGIRSMDQSEMEHVNPEKIFYAHDIVEASDDWMDEVLAKCTEHVYITIDLDAFDPSVLPSTGTPEPGGLRYYQTLRLLKKVITAKKIVGFDIVELCPNQEERSSDFFSAKLYYKILSYIYHA